MSAASGGITMPEITANANIVALSVNHLPPAGALTDTCSAERRPRDAARR
jgi:hypothetical protein